MTEDAEVDDVNANASMPSDNPIKDAQQDLLGRKTYARVLANEIRSLDASEGYVLGVVGAWGSGKTSLLNLVRNELEKAPALPVLEFNPWLFSGTEGLVESFFAELSAQLRLRPGKLPDLANALEAYGQVLAPLRFLPGVGVWIERFRGASSSLKQLMDQKRKGIAPQRTLVSEKLNELEQPIVVVIDDIDRLRTIEIRDIFKLVRLTANFPNIVYVLAFDRARVESALGEDGIDGRLYLEKILQVAFDLPLIPEQVLTKQITDALDKALEHIEPAAPFNVALWPDIFFEVIRPLIRNMRDVRRYVAALSGTLRHLEGQIELSDVLALEAVRVFDPDMYEALIRAREVVTQPAAGFGVASDDTQPRNQVDAIFNAGDAQHREVGIALIKRVFLAGSRYAGGSNYGADWQRKWLRERRVTHPDLLALYLERVPGEGLLAFGVAEQAFTVIGDPNAFESLLADLSPEELENTISVLEAYEGEYPVESVVPATVVLLNAMSRLPLEAKGMFGIDADIVVTRVVLRLFRQLGDATEVEAAVRGVLPQVRSLWARLQLLGLVGHREDVGLKLVSESAMTELEEELRSTIQSSSGGTLANERHLLNLLHWAKTTDSDGGASRPLPASHEFEVALLKASMTEVRSRPMGDRAVTRTKQLNWDALLIATGGEDAVDELIQRAKAYAIDDGELALAIELGEKYLTGWRPTRFGG